MTNAERQAKYRERVRNARNVTAVTPEENATPGDLKSGPSRLRQLETENEALRAEVKDLKHRLSVANGGAEAGRPVESVTKRGPATSAAEGPGTTRSARATANEERTCGGPGRCGVLGCSHPGYGGRA